MSKIHIPNKLREFHKVFDQFGSYKHDVADLFDKFLEWMMWGFCADGSLTWEPIGYDDEERKLVFELFKAYVQTMDREVSDDSWFDLFGTYYEVYIASKSRRDSKGQFFTPPYLCDMMSKATIGDDMRGKGVLIGDPACGSGRCLLSAHVNGAIGNFLCAEDIDRTCCMMTVCNFLFHGCVGEVVWHNSLDPESWYYGWRVNEGLNNPFHKHFGVPHVTTIQKEQSAVWNHWQNRKEEIQKEKEQKAENKKEEQQPKKQQYIQLNLFD